jgi:hypothetical protein
MRSYMIEGFLLVFLVSEVSAQSLSGSYTVGPGGTYATLTAAFAGLSTNGASGPVTFLITGNITEPNSPSLTTGTLNSSRTLTVRPNAGVTATITIPSASSIIIVGTDHVTIDGSNSGGTSRDLTIKHSGMNVGNQLIFIGTFSSNILIANCVLSGPTNTSDCAIYCARCSDVTIENNEIHGIGTNNDGILTLYRVKGTTNVIRKNTISGDQASSNWAVGIVITDTTGTVLISKNRLHNLRTSGSDGIVGIWMDNARVGLVKIYNNFIGGNFVATGTAPQYIYLIAQRGSGSTASVGPASDIVHNTLVLNSISGSGYPDEAANFSINRGNANLRNNILCNMYDVTGSFCIANYLSVPTGLTSDNNDLVVSGSHNAIGFGTETYSTLSDWQAWTGVNPDPNSVSRLATFVNATNDFHLAGGSVGDSQLRGSGSFLATVADDIDGDARYDNPDGPYMGADEAAAPLPIQLTMFTATVANSSEVCLSWSTVSETDNYGFEVQKAKAVTGPFGMIENGFVAGHGTTLLPHKYKFTDSMVCSGQWYYRLKQIDVNGDIHYCEAILVTIENHPTVFELNQNYPNPFNPTTVVRYQLPAASNVRLAVYDLLGREVAVLVDEKKVPGSYEVKFDGSGLSSGMYFYRMEAGSFVETRKLLLIR